MAIPGNITRDHIFKAFEYINKHGVPKERRSRKYYVVDERKKYPPKYVISLANFYPNSKELDSNEFDTYMAQDYLNQKGFKTIPPHP